MIGSAEDCDLRAAEPTLSRYHAEFSAAAGGIRVRDLGSTNGVTCAGVKLRDGVVPPGAELELGAFRVRVLDASLGHDAVSAEDTLGPLIARSPAMRKLVARLAKVAATEDGGADRRRARERARSWWRGRSTTKGRGARGPSSWSTCPRWRGRWRRASSSGTSGARSPTPTRRGPVRSSGLVGARWCSTTSPSSLSRRSRSCSARSSVESGRRLGGREDIAYDARIVATTARDLRREVNAGRFRLDLYYRLAVVRLEVPELDERSEDLRPLVAGFLQERGVGLAHPLLDDDRLEALAARDWPGNVRELRNVVEAALALDELAELDEEESGDEETAAESTEALIESLTGVPYKEARARFSRALERAYLTDLARRARGNLSAAARLASLDRSQLRQLLARNGVRIEHG